MIKGWYEPEILKYPYDEQSCDGARCYVEEIPANAIRAESDVEETIRIYTQDGVMAQKLERTGYVIVPAHLIGKRVKAIIMEVENE